MKKSNFFLTIVIIATLSFHLLTLNGLAQYNKVLDFAGTTNGSNPLGSLISDGTFLYGMTSSGSTNGNGTIFKIMPDGTGYSNLLDFAGSTNGSDPRGSLISDGTFLYGMTRGGGTNSKGTIFKIKPDGTGFVKLLDFDGSTNGSNPQGSLFSDGTFLYGMTYGGGANSKGTIFKIKPDGTGYVNLLDFAGSTNGMSPRGSLISDGTFLYGTTSGGGGAGIGTIFKIMPDGSGYFKLRDFNNDGNGGFPYGSLITDGTFLYGMTSTGGTSFSGVIFKIMPDGTGYSKLLDFAGTANGSDPYGSLFSDGVFLYGMTKTGGTNNVGTVFKIMPDGTGYSKLLDFAGIVNGSSPYGTLISDGTFLYGMTSGGGANSSGTTFKIMPDGTGYSDLLDFVGSNGSAPRGSLISDGTFLYGMTKGGGYYGAGLIFKIKPDGTGYGKLLDFGGGGGNGSSPEGSLFSDGTFLYGMTRLGGTNSGGIIFKIKPDGTGYVKLFDFAASGSGDKPYGSLISDGTFLYGMTSQGGTSNNGTIFKIMFDGTGFVKLLDFNGTNGGNPLGSLISDGTFLYGMTYYGGTGTCYSGCGVIFKIKPDGTGYTKLYEFAATANGSSPYGSLYSDGTFLYGMTVLNGTNGYGTAFKIKPDGTNFIKLLDFSFSSSGFNAHGDLISDGTFLYGMTYVGGPGACYEGCGVIFKIKADGTGYHKLLTFLDVTNGSKPNGSLISDGTFLYGMTENGGANTKGTVFKFNLLDTNNLNQSLTICAGENATVGAHTYITNGNYLDTLMSYQGCDSIVATNLTVLSANTFSQTLALCSGQSVTVGSNTYSASGTYSDILISSVSSCDSTVTTNLTVNAVEFPQTLALCSGQSVTIGGNTYSATGTYSDLLTSSVSGCDSTVTTNLTVNTVDISVSVLNATITVNEIGATYQWINCNGNITITGQNNQSFTATANGSYAVIVTKNNCSDTSACNIIATTGIVENSLATSMSIYPNPFISQTTITFNKEQKNINIQITDELGKEVKTINFTGKQLIIEKEEMKAGIYFVKAKTDQGIISKKIIFNK